MRRSGWYLALAGLLGIAFFWLTDPRYGPLGKIEARDNFIDAVNHASIGSLIGAIGSAVVLVIGVWLVTRRPV